MHLIFTQRVLQSCRHDIGDELRGNVAPLVRHNECVRHLVFPTHLHAIRQMTKQSNPNNVSSPYVAFTYISFGKCAPDVVVQGLGHPRVIWASEEDQKRAQGRDKAPVERLLHHVAAGEVEVLAKGCICQQGTARVDCMLIQAVLYKIMGKEGCDIQYLGLCR